MFYIKGYKYYVDTVCSFYITMKLLASEYNFNVSVTNLSKYCQSDERGISCLQYYINAEYCPIYSLYFLYAFSKHGGKHDEASLRNSVRECYISEPSTISRYITKENNILLVTYTSFLMTVLTLLSSRAYFLTKVYEKYRAMQAYEIEILEPSVLQLLQKKLGMIGGRGKDTTKRTKTKAKKAKTKKTTKTQKKQKIQKF